MKYLDEYRDPVAIEKLRQAIAAVTTRSWTIMEICGGQTHTIVKYGIDELLPPEITLVHGPGCPVPGAVRGPRPSVARPRQRRTHVGRSAASSFFWPRSTARCWPPLKTRQRSDSRPPLAQRSRAGRAHGSPSPPTLWSCV